MGVKGVNYLSKDPEKKARQLANLIPVKKGEKRPPEQVEAMRRAQKERHLREKREREFREIVKDILFDPEIVDQMIKKRPGYFKSLEDEEGIVTPNQAIIAAQLAKAIAGDTRAFEALVKAGYGDLLKVEGSVSIFDNKKIEIEIVPPRKIKEEERNAEEAEVVENS